MAIRSSKAIEVFFSYSHSDKELRDKLGKHISFLEHNKWVRAWYDGEINPGTEWEEQIYGHLNAAGLILLLVSSDFMASRFCYDIEMTRAIERHDDGTARVIPIILRPCVWKKSPFGKLQALPKGGKAVTTWPNRDVALADVAADISQAVEELRGKPAASTTTKPKREVASKLDDRYKLRQLRDSEMTDEEREVLRKDAETLANRFVEDQELQKQICRAAKKMLELNRGMSLSKEQLEKLDERFLLKRDKRKYPDPKKVRWVLRAARLHPQGRRRTLMT